MATKKPPAEVKASPAELLDWMERAEKLIDQLNNLYRMYSTGIEKLVPIEKRQHLEALMFRIAQAPKSKTELKYRYDALQGKFGTYRDRWERLLRDIEAGRIKRS